MTAPTDLLPGSAGKTAFVTGAAGGIGRAVVDLFRTAGVNVGAADREGLDPPSEGYLPLVMDATAERQVVAAIGSVAHRWGAIDYVVHCVGKTGVGPLADLSLDAWNDMMATNLTSAFLVAREASRRFRKPGGVLVWFASTNGLNGGTRFSGPGYGAAKAGIVNLTRYLAREWAPDGLRVCCIAPGPVDTPMLDRLSDDDHTALKAGIPLGAYTTADEIAATVAFLCSPHASTMTGTVTNVSGGLVLD